MLRAPAIWPSDPALHFHPTAGSSGCRPFVRSASQSGPCVAPHECNSRSVWWPAIDVDESSRRFISSSFCLGSASENRACSVNAASWFPSVKSSPICPARSRRSAKPHHRRSGASPRLRSGEPACLGQRDDPRSRFHGPHDGAVLPAPHQPRQPERVQFGRNGPYTLGMTAGLSNKLPFGNYPRLLLAWVSTEAVRTQSRELVLGKSLAEFMRELGIHNSGGPGRNQAPQPNAATVRLHRLADLQG